MHNVYREHHELFRTDWLQIYCKELGRLVLYTCIPMGLFTLESSSRTPVQFSACDVNETLFGPWQVHYTERPLSL